MIQKFVPRYHAIDGFQYTGSMESRAQLAEFAADHVHVPAVEHPTLKTVWDVVMPVRPEDWVLRYAPDDFRVYSEATLKHYFAPYGSPMTNPPPPDNIDDHQVEALAAALKGMTSYADDRSAALLERAVEEADNQPMVPRYGEDVPLAVDVGVDFANEDSDRLVHTFVIDHKHPHSKLIQSIIAMTGVSQMDPPIFGTALAHGQPYEVALVAMKAGYRVTREDYLGKVWFTIGEGRHCRAEGFWNKHTRRFAEDYAKRAMDRIGGTSNSDINVVKLTSVPVAPYIIAVDLMREEVHMGFVIDGNDQLANDWIILED